MNKLFQTLLLVVGAVVLHGYAPDAEAAFICSTPQVSYLTPPAPAQIDPSVAVGRDLWSGTVDVGASAGGACTGAWPSPATIDFVGSQPYRGSNIYDSGIPGIGYTVRFTAGSVTNALWPTTYTYGWGQGVGAHQVTVTLIKTGPISQGGTLTGKFAQWNVHQVGGVGAPAEYEDYVWNGSFVITPKNPTCEVSTQNVVVKLDNAETSNFPSISSTAKEKDFQVNLACSGGDAGTKTEVNMSLTDQTTPGNVSTALSLTSASTATGIAIQIVRNGSAIGFNPVTNKFKVQDVLPGNSTVDIPFKARYVRTGTITPGKVQGIAVFTMDYK
ncbi:fimbrial protein [Lysobacter sp. FW306-1B-D06B]|uniref:fimbrial protein n=1 Tax=Lysobacter sp. FW306-1B-D06B TaxID=3140250 RepID=UPI00314033F1